MRLHLSGYAMLIAAALSSPAWAEEAPYESFRAADFTRGERLAVGEISVGLYSHYQRFDQVLPSGQTLDGASEIHHTRYIPVLFLDHQPIAQLRGTAILHGGVVQTDLRDPGGQRFTDTIAGLGDLYLVAQWSPWLGGIPSDHTHALFDLHNLSFVIGPKIDLARQDDGAGTVPGAVFRRTSTGSHDANAALVYTAHLTSRSWLYDYAQWTLPFTRNNFGYRPGMRVSDKVGASWLPGEALQLFVEAEYAWQDRGQGGRLAPAVQNSGGHLVTLTPGMTVDVQAGWGIELSMGFPLVHEVNGVQPRPDFDLLRALQELPTPRAGPALTRHGSTARWCAQGS